MRVLPPRPSLPRRALAAVAAIAAALSGCGYLAELVPSTCIAGGIECDGACVDPDTSAAHCGQCENACEQGDACIDGECTSHCEDGARGPGESDADCGGTCAPCASGRRCDGNGDCASGNCAVNVCSDAPSCTDGKHNGDETGVDCGGSCPACVPTCSGPQDCASGVCRAGRCAEPACDDGAANGDESDQDCGGRCVSCALGRRCKANADCQSRGCVGGLCATPTCQDGTPDGLETGTDCGGGASGSGCPACPVGAACRVTGDCAVGTCTDGRCQPATCTDQRANGDETGVDCGGPDCRPCPANARCKEARDCETLVCTYQSCQPATCVDRVRNGAESDVDCGGLQCPKCRSGRCDSATDCASGVCDANVCLAVNRLEVTVGGSATGRVTSAPTGIDCPGTCAAFFPAGSTVALHATPTTGAFGGWTGACAGLGACSVALGADAAVGAAFTDEQPALWARVAGAQLQNNFVVVGVAEGSSDDVWIAANFGQDATFAGVPISSGTGPGILVARLGAAGEPLLVKVLAGALDLRVDAIAVDSEGFAIAGSFSGAFDPGGGALSSTSRDAFVARFSASAVHRWSAAIGGASDQDATGVSLWNGSTYVIGSDLQQGLLLARYDEAGVPVWSRSYGGRLGGVSVPRVAAWPGGGVVVAGAFSYGAAVGGLDLGGGPLYASSWDLFVARLADDGGHVWSRTYPRGGGLHEFSPGSLDVDGAGTRILVSGMQNGTIDFGGPWAGRSGACFGVLDATGAPVLSGLVERGDPMRSGLTTPVAAFAPDGGVFFAASFSGGVVPFGGAQIAPRLGVTDGLLLRYGADGALRWQKRIGDAASCVTEIVALDVGAQGHVYPAGVARVCTAFGATHPAHPNWQTGFVARLAP